MKTNRPMIITFIGDLHIFYAILLILPLLSFLKQFGIIEYSSTIPALLDDILRLLHALILLIISYGYLKVKTWGYWSVIFYNLFTITEWITLNRLDKLQFFPQNIVLSIFLLILTVPTITNYKKYSKSKI